MKQSPMNADKDINPGQIIFSCQLMGNDFIYENNIFASSYKIDRTLRNCILAMDTEDKERFV